MFHDGRRCGFVMGWAHFSDIGGMRAGSISPDTSDIFQEGIIVPPTKLIDAGTTNEATLKIFFRNSRFPEQNMGDMRALMASGGARREAHRGDRRPLRRRRAWPTRCASSSRAPASWCATKLAETFDYGTHRFTDAIDSDGHGNGPFHLRLALTRETRPDGEDQFIFDATATDDQSPGPVNLLLNPDVPGTALSMFYLGGDPAQVCNAGGPQALDEVRLREGSLLWPQVARAARHARPHADALPGGGERADQRRGRQGAGRALGLRHLLHARHLHARSKASSSRS